MINENEIKKTYEYLQKLKDDEHKEIERLNKDLQTSMDICNNRQKEIVRLNNIIDKALCSIASCDWNDKYVVETYDILKGSEDNEKK